MPKKYLTESQREKAREASRKYRAAHLETCRARTAASERSRRASDPEKCREQLRQSYYRHIEKRRADDRQRNQTESRKAYKRNRYAKDPQKIRDQQKARHLLHREHDRELARQRYAKHADDINAIRRKARQEDPEKYQKTERENRLRHPERSRQTANAWRKKNPQRTTVYNNKQRARRRAIPLRDFTLAQWQTLQAAFDHRCAYCHKRCKGHLTQDHITPLSKGGSHTLSNIIPTCKSCNCRKHTGPPPIPVQPLLL